MTHVAFQGEPGAYSEVAVLQLFPDARPLPSPTFQEVFDRVESGEAAWGVLPIENSLTGSIKENYDLLAERSVTLVGETVVPVQHCLMALPGQTLDDIREVLSHPQGLEQSSAFLGRMNVEQVPAYDTAGSAKLIRQQERRGAAAVASRRAAEIYRLEILAERIQNQADNFTRFVAIALPGKTPPFDLAAPRKSSLILGLPNVPGALHHALGVLARRDIQLTRLESRPNRKKPWEYLFYLEFEGDLQSPRIAEAMAELRQSEASIVPLGSYPQARMP
ncbi:P-protein [compost metagenome]